MVCRCSCVKKRDFDGVVLHCAGFQIILEFLAVSKDGVDGQRNELWSASLWRRINTEVAHHPAHLAVIIPCPALLPRVHACMWCE